MKNKNIFFASFLACAITVVHLNASAAPPILSTADNTNATVPVPHGFATDATLAFADLKNDIKLMTPFTTNGNATARIAIGINTASHEEVTAFAIEVPTSEHTALGVVVANIGSKFYEGGLNLTLGITNNWPVIGIVRSFAGDGIVYDFINREPANYSFMGFLKDWEISSKFDFGAGVIAANTSDRAGVDLMGGVHLTWWFGKRPVN